jgi:hypothetical protein
MEKVIDGLNNATKQQEYQRNETIDPVTINRQAVDSIQGNRGESYDATLAHVYEQIVE